jgi:hypothetical protein
MGMPVNAAVFEAVARTLPLKLLARHRGDPAAVETLLLGQAGLPLDATSAQEYRFWQRKYQLCPVAEPVSFLRMRPAHAPAVRLRQLATLLEQGTGWFALIRDANSLGEVLAALGRSPGIGPGMRLGILVNAFVPLVYACGQEEKAIRWLEALPAEKNSLLQRWAQLGMGAAHAMDAQGLLELKKEYCNARRCLECAIGRALLGK